MPELITKFFRYLRVNNYSKSSLRTYGAVLKNYQIFLEVKQIKPEKYFSIETAVAYKKYLRVYRGRRQQKLTKNSLQKFYGVVKLFHNFLLKESYILVNPYTMITPIKSPVKIIKKNIPVNTVEKILSQPDLSRPTGYRDRTILELFYSTGIRRGELHGLKVYDVDLSNGLLKVSGKGDKDRIVPLGKRAGKYLETYLNKIRPQLVKNLSEESLFIGISGRALSWGTIGIYVSKYVRAAEAKKSYSCHSFRHTCAVEMLKGRASIKHVKEMLGHARLTTTQLYTELMPADLKKIHQETHPSNWIFNELD